MTREFVITEKTGLPEFGKRGRKAHYPFDRLDVGMAFFVPDVSLRQGWSIVGYWNRKCKKTKKFFRPEESSRQGRAGVRVWRVR